MKRDERGVTAVEAALVSPFIILLLFTVFQSAFVARTYIAVRDGAAAGARADSIESTNADADYNALQAIQTSNASLAKNVGVVIVIFKSTSQNGVMDPGCLTAAIPQVCNRYTQSDFNLSQPQLAKASYAQAWAPSTRSASRLGVDDYVGVYVSIPVNYNVWPFPNSFSQSSIVRLQVISD